MAASFEDSATCDYHRRPPNNNRCFVSTNDMPLFVSVIVPVWNDAERLRHCLQALEAQTYPHDLYEVIVVDNHSTERIGHVVSRYAHARLVHETRPGSYAARNAGMASARGKIIAFTDADCIPASDWLEKGVGHLTLTEGCAVLAGRIEIFPRLAQQPNAIERYEGLVALAQREFVRKYSFGAEPAYRALGNSSIELLQHEAACVRAIIVGLHAVAQCALIG
jgi:glycosyltransferase involved in cell wall biosynthesis